MANWSDAELEAAVRAYLRMREDTQDGRAFIKDRIYQELADRYGRTPGAWEFRMRNISTVMEGMGREIVPGLIPAENVGVGVASQLERLIRVIESADSMRLDSEEIRRSLQPTERQRIIDVVANAGIDISDWAESTKGNPNSNPKYCYEWVFGGDGEPTLVCLWYEDIRTDNDGVLVSYSLWPVIERLGRAKKPNRQKRASDLDTALQIAFRSKVPIRVAVVEGRMNEMDDEKSSQAKFRVLDSEAWRVTHVDYSDGTFVIRRGPFSSEQKESAGIVDSVGQEASASQPGSDSALIRDVDDLQQRDLDSTTRQRLVDARLGQGAFRKDLMREWAGRCSATGCAISALLRASHIKPWRDSTDGERLDTENGLLLTANLDALFDRGLIGFEADGRLWVSEEIGEEERVGLALPVGLSRPPSPRQREYLQQHKEVNFGKRSGK